MEKFEIRPRLFNLYTVMYGVLLIASVVFLGRVVWYRAFLLHIEYPNETAFLQIMYVSILPVLIFLIFFIVSIKSRLGRLISIEKDLVYFKIRTKLGFGNWKIDKLINLSKVKSITDRRMNYYISTGKGLIPTAAYWIVFNEASNQKQEILFNGWNINDIKSFFYYIKGKYPKIIFNTKIMMDNSSKIAEIS